MSTPKGIFLELIKPDGQPERQLCQYEALHMCLTDPINTYLRGNRKRGTVSKDRWGTTISFPEDAPGPIPVHTPELTVCPDVTHWRDTVHVPDLSVCSEGWEECRTRSRAAADAEGKLLAGFMGTGIFEQCHFLMGFEDTLTALYEHPDEMHELIETITQYRLDYVRRLIDGLQPDVIFSHDDWGTKNALFMKPDMWREFFKEPYRRFYGYIRSRGVITIHHADSYLVPIVDDILRRGKRPILVGGTGLYFQGLLHGIADNPLVTIITEISVPDGNAVAGHPDTTFGIDIVDPELYAIPVVPVRGIKDHHVIDTHPSEAGHAERTERNILPELEFAVNAAPGKQFIDQDPIPGQQGRHHRLRRDDELVAAENPHEQPSREKHAGTCGYPKDIVENPSHITPVFRPKGAFPTICAVLPASPASVPIRPWAYAQ